MRRQRSRPSWGYVGCIRCNVGQPIDSLDEGNAWIVKHWKVCKRPDVKAPRRASSEIHVKAPRRARKATRGKAVGVAA